MTVPVLWDKQTQTIVNNESREIMRMFDVEFALLAMQKIDLYPCDLQQKIDETIDAIYLPINAGVYRAGFAREQAVYCNNDYTKRAYYMSMTEINPNQIVPKGPIIDFDERHDRDRFVSYLA